MKAPDPYLFDWNGDEPPPKPPRLWRPGWRAVALVCLVLASCVLIVDAARAEEAGPANHGAILTAEGPQGVDQALGGPAAVPDPPFVQAGARYVPASRSGREAVADVIAERASAHGVAPGPLIALARCESTLDAGAVGDHGHSHGLAQLSDLPGTGLLADFYRRGYSDPYDAYEAADYLSAVAAGEFPGIRLSRWSCAR